MSVNEAALTKQIAELKETLLAEKNTFKNREDDLNKNLMSVEEQNNQLKSDNEILKSQRKIAEENYKNLNEEHIKCKEKIEKINAEFLKKENGYQNAQKKFSVELMSFRANLDINKRYKENICELNRQIEILDLEKRDLTNKTNEYSNDKINYESKFKHASTELQEKNKTLQEKEGLIGNLRDENNLLKTKLLALETSTKQETENLENQIEKIKLAYTKQENDLREAESSYRKFKNQKDSLERQISEKSRISDKYNELNNRNKELEIDIKESKKNYDVIKSKFEIAESKILELNSSIENLNKEIEKLKSENTILSRTNDFIKEFSSKVNSECKKCIKKKEKIEKKSEKIRNNEKLIDNLKKEILDLQIKIKELESINQKEKRSSHAEEFKYPKGIETESELPYVAEQDSLNSKLKYENEQLVEKIKEYEEKFVKISDENKKILEENQKLAEKLPYEKSDTTYSKYDFIIDIKNFSDLIQVGWNIEFPQSNIESRQDYDHLIKEIGNASAIIGIIGDYKKGKTFILNKLCNLNLISNQFSVTKGISFKSSKFTNKKVCFLDTIGSKNPYNLPKLSKDYQRKVDKNINKIVCSIAHIIVVVINNFNTDEQKFIEKLRKKFENSEIFIIHNLKDVNDEDSRSELFTNNLQSLGLVEDAEEIENYNINTFEKDKTIHFSFINDYSNYGNQYNKGVASLINRKIKDLAKKEKEINIMNEISSYLSDPNSYHRPSKVKSINFDDLSPEPDKIYLFKTPFISIFKLIEQNTILIKSDTNSKLIKLDENEYKPPNDIFKNQEKYAIIMDLPGVDGNNIQYSVEKRIFTISGERLVDFKDLRKLENDSIDTESIPVLTDSEELIYRKRKFGKFSKFFAIPGEYKKEFKSDFKDGVLRIEFPVDE